MSEILILGLLLLAVGAAIILISIAVSPYMRARLRLPFGGLFEIESKRPHVSKPSLDPTQPRPQPQRHANAKQVAWLAIKQPGRADWKYELDGSAPIYIGRREDNQVNLARDPAADTRHAVIYSENNRYYINNLSSKGTRVNNRLIAKQVLGDGNTIQMGNTRIIFHESRR